MPQLIYHMYPRAGEALNLNLKLLRSHLHIFDKVCIGVALDSTTLCREAVEHLLPIDAKTFYFENNSVLGEAMTFGHFLPGIERVGYTFYGHSKGVSQRLTSELRKWITACYDRNLDRVPREGVPCSGCFRLDHPHEGYGTTSQNWHYSGTFFWFDNARLRAKSDWLNLHSRNRYAIEVYLSWHFAKEEAECRCGLNEGIFYGNGNDRRIDRILGVASVARDGFNKQKLRRAKNVTVRQTR